MPYTSATQAFAINHGPELCSAAASIPGYIFARSLRRQFGLASSRLRVIPVPLSMLVPAAMAGMVHQKYVVHDILLQETVCPVCIETRAIAMQVTAGSLLPFASALAGTLVVGQFDNARWMPRTARQFGSLAGKSLSATMPLVLGMTVVQLLVVGGLVHQEVWCYEDVMQELNRRYEQDHPEVRDQHFK